MVYVEEHVKDNYRKVKAERGCSWEQLAEEFAVTDRNLAAWFRSQAGPEKPKRGVKPGQQETR